MFDVKEVVEVRESDSHYSIDEITAIIFDRVSRHGVSETFHLHISGCDKCNKLFQMQTERLSGFTPMPEW